MATDTFSMARFSGCVGLSGCAAFCGCADFSGSRATATFAVSSLCTTGSATFGSERDTAGAALATAAGVAGVRFACASSAGALCSRYHW